MILPRPAPPTSRKLRTGDLALALILIGVGWLILRNILVNLGAAGITPGFGFLWSEAGFDVSEALIPYSPSDSYARVILTGLVNTLFLAAVSLIFATLLGLGGGVLGVSPSPVSRALASGYVELFRNLPKLLVLLVLFIVAVNGLPPVRSAIHVGSIAISNRSFYFPALEANAALWALLLGLVAGAAASAWLLAAQRSRGVETGRRSPFWPLALSPLIVLPWAAAALAGAPLVVSTPVLQGFDFVGGARLSVQFVVVAATLALYHGAQIAEVVRGAVEATPRGQWEAAAALGLNRRQTLRLIVVPQVFRAVIPPLNNQYVNLIKNTSVAIAVGYSDLMSVAGTTINQTFRPLEMMLLTMGVYLAICLAVTSLLNSWSDAIRRREQR